MKLKVKMASKTQCLHGVERDYMFIKKSVLRCRLIAVLRSIPNIPFVSCVGRECSQGMLLLLLPALLFRP